MLKNKHADSWLGTHQKLNRHAYRALKRYLTLHDDPLSARSKLAGFPSVKLLNHFEGINGPDGMKIKSPGQNELQHFYDPYTDGDHEIFGMLTSHQKELRKALAEDNQERAAFEASWLAHTVVDGLTPAHQFPYEKSLEELRGEGHETRNTKAKKLIIKGQSTKDTISKNWKFLGAKGLLSTHMNFEGGVASVLLPLRLPSAIPSRIEVAYAQEHGLIETFRLAARGVADLQLYDRFYQNGWTIAIARDVRGLLLPQMIKTVSLAWLLSLEGK